MIQQGAISAEDLAAKLATSKKIMKKVDTGNYEKGNINEGMISKSPEELVQDVNMPSPQTHKSLGLPVGVPSVDKIRKSKLPDNIKTAMIEKPIPIPDISLSEGLNMNLINKAKQLMEQDGNAPSKSSGRSTQPTNPQDKQHMREQRELSMPVENSELETIIENVIRRVLDEKLTQILTAQQLGTINENLVLKVGNSIFQGKITKVKSSK